MKRIYLLSLTILLSALSLSAQENRALESKTWEMLTAEGEITGRHECSFVELGGMFYLLGGRGVNEVAKYDPQTNSWTQLSKSPLEIHHFQAVVYNDDIYIACAMTGKYPKETPLENVWIYHTKSDEWEKGHSIPAEHQRGGGGAVLYSNKIYIACGIEYGHTSGTNNTFSCYDPVTGEWSMLTRAPHIRDHFPAIVVEDKLYCIGGRNGSVHHPDNFQAFFDAVEGAVDVYDFKSEKWTTLPAELPTPTAAGGIVAVGDKIIYMGGEGSDKLAYSNTQCLDTQSGEWQQLAPMAKGMHGSSAIYFEGAIYWAAGSYKQGGSNLSIVERFK